jgi:FkbM family methyltransferase
MGIIEGILKFTPFFRLYKKFKQERTDKKQKALEAKLLPARVAFYKELVEPGQLVFDVGANVGNRVEAFLECKARVVAVEPQPGCVEILREKFGDKITIENVGLSEEIGELEMQIASDTTVSTFSKEYISKTKSRFKYSKWEKTIKVPVTTLETLIGKHGMPTFCKIDVEGFELQVLKGLKTPIPSISIEYCAPEMQDQSIECIKYLHKLCPTAIFNYSIGESMVWALKEWKTYGDFIAHLRTKEFADTSFGDIYIKCR